MTFRPLFVNEGALGEGVVGHPRVEDAIRPHLEHHPEIGARFVRLPAMGRITRTIVRGVPGLAAIDADAQRTRWHLAQSLRARAVVRAALRDSPADAVHVNSHTIGLAISDVMRDVPTYLSVDATIRAWEHLAVWRPVRPWTDALLAPSYTAERRAFAAAAGIAAWTAWAGAEVLAACPGAVVHVIHPGIDLERFRPPPSRVPTTPLRVLFVGGRFREKGGELMLEALRRRLGRDVALDVVTTSSVRATEGVTVHRLGAASDELIRLFQHADVFCLPTRADAAPFAIVEALACGVPVVSTDVAAIPELLGDGAAGITVAPGDVGALRAALDAVLDDPGRRAAMSSAGRARCEQLYDNRRQSARLLELMGAGR